MIKIAHLVDDCAMGGVMVALKNFDDPRLTSFSCSRTVEVRPKRPSAPKLDDDIIIVHFTVSWRKLPFLMSLRFRNRKATIILIEHSYTEGFERWNVPDKTRFHQMLRWNYACVDEVVAVSQAQAAWLTANTRARKISAIPQSRVLNSFEAVASIAKKPGEPIVFGAIGRFHEQKGFDDLIAAFRNPALDGVRLIIAGAGEQEARLKELAAGAVNIQFIGPVDDPASFYAHVDCVIIPSRWEAFGLVASEAMAAGRFVIASEIDGLTEQARDYGVLVAPDNAAALWEAMLDVSRMTPERLTSLSEAARTAALKRYDAMIDAWKEKLSACAYGDGALRASSAAALKPRPSITSPGQ